MSADNSQHPGLVGAWLAFTRPKTWLLAASPVIAALSLAWFDTREFRPVVALFTITIAVLMQAITNMENDLGYTERNAETGNRRGLPRATTRGWISRSAAKTAIRIGAALALLNTAVLIAFGGWGFLAVGLASLVAAYCYMGGPKPIAYTPFGEITVLIFFGLTAVCGTYYLQTGAVSANAVLLGAGLGAVATGVLAVNNFRDVEHDASIGRRTLAVTVGPSVFVNLFAGLMLIPYAAIVAMVILKPALWPCIVTLGSLPKAFRLVGELTQKRHEELNAVMFGCVRLEGLFSMLFSAGALAAAWA